MKRILTAALIAVSATVAHAEAFSGVSPCHVWTDGVASGERPFEIGYAQGFADLWSVTMDGIERPFRYGDLVAAIDRECYRDPTQMIAIAAARAMKTFKQ
ncbi:hypothetical protein QYH69_32320 [Paraburkholderia sp. SARCC-3016]|uniref:hypothetical protein n=1 Tax=Paraburkholderia sp. SARCC-3016 TaxID=3058611 RepID=UPI0028079C82|nr:hypothetical protein [Paraburkholderia sp. SARCC-3016]MDQ7981910.1 hypothetical protein [Paraburkholderia sp. SARCC-3016]